MLSGSDARKEARKHRPASIKLKQYETKFTNLGEEYKKALTEFESQSELSNNDQNLINKLNAVITAIENLKSD